jgi:hypothetical protein
MQQFTVPQFIDVEDKIIGPITARQFVIMLSSFLLMGLFYRLFNFSFFLTFSLVTFVISVTFSFVKINGKPFHFFVLNFIQTSRRPGLRVWNNKIKGDEFFIENEETVVSEIVKVNDYRSMTTSRLAELSLIVDTKGAYGGETEENSEKIIVVNDEKAKGF